MSFAILQNQKVRRRLDIGKSTYISIGLHLIVIFGITFANVYDMPVFEDSPIINVRLANAAVEQDGFLTMSEEKMEAFSPEKAETLSNRKEMRAERYKVKRLEANSEVNSSEAFYLNAWQRKVETIGNLNYPSFLKKREINSKLTLSVTIGNDGSLLDYALIKSSGDNQLDNAAIQIIELAFPFKNFPEEMVNFSEITIIRDWQFGNRDS